MIHKLALSLISALVLTATYAVQAQQLHKCDTAKSYWVLSKDTSRFAVQLSGQARETDRPGVIAVNTYPLQGMVLDKKGYVKEGEDNSDVKVLVRYAVEETEYFSKQFKSKINVQMQQVPFGDDHRAVVWFFEMPEGASTQVAFQLFANVVMGDKIVGFSSSQFVGQDFAAVKDFLMDTLSTLKKVQRKDVDALCVH